MDFCLLLFSLCRKLSLLRMKMKPKLQMTVSWFIPRESQAPPTAPSAAAALLRAILMTTSLMIQETNLRLQQKYAQADTSTRKTVAPGMSQVSVLMTQSHSSQISRMLPAWNKPLLQAAACSQPHQCTQEKTPCPRRRSQKQPLHPALNSTMPSPFPQLTLRPISP